MAEMSRTARSLPPGVPVAARAAGLSPGDARELVDRQHLPLAGQSVGGEQVGQGTGLGDGGLAGALKRAVPGISIGEAATPVQSRAEPPPQRPEPKGDVINALFARLGRRCGGWIARGDVGSHQPASVQAGRELR
jgi:hypothetical protein